MIKTIPSISIQVKSNNSILQTSTPILIPTSYPVTTGNTYIFQGGTTGRFDTLEDVVEVTPETGEVPVYDSTNDKYEVKRLDFDDLVGDIDDVDGGSF